MLAAPGDQHSTGPPRLSIASSVVLDGRLMIFGGKAESADFTADLFAFDFVAASWLPLNFPLVGGSSPTPRCGASMAHVQLGGLELGVLFGGLTSDFVLGARHDISNELHILFDAQVDVG